MPWTQDQYEYPYSLVRHLLANLAELVEILYAHGDPATDAAAVVWDLESALAEIGLTRRQEKVLLLSSTGADVWQIAYTLGISPWSVEYHLRSISSRAKDFLNYDPWEEDFQVHE